MRHYRQSEDVSIKADGSPITLADEASHRAISELLSGTGVPVVSEEGSDLLMDAERYWIVDPLDGTKDFLAGNGEFTINIALIESGRPVLGVVYAPAINELFVGEVGECTWTLINGIRSDCEIPTTRSSRLRLAASRFHDHPDLAEFQKINDVVERIQIGSALKYCRLAQGTLDVFPRLVGSSEWDTAAGQVVVESAGGAVLDWRTGRPLTYGKANRRNPRLLSFRAPYAFEDFNLMQFEPELL